MFNDLISIIIPVYNVREFLSECLDSALNQTYNNIEIIIIDDGSNDGSDIICDEYARKSPLINVVHKENGGLSDARNCGLELCKGEFVTFIDSDDKIDETYIEELHRLISINNVLVASISYEKIDSNNIIIPDKKKNGINYNISMIYNRDEIIKGILLRSFHYAAWGSMYRIQALKGISFAKGKKNEDILFWMDLIDNVDSVVYCDLPLYKYRMRSGSITTGIDVYWDAIQNANDINEKIRVKYPGLYEYSEYNYLYYLFLYAKLGSNREENSKFVIKTIRKKIFKMLLCEHFSVSEKIQIMLLIMNLNILKTAIKRN